MSFVKVNGAVVHYRDEGPRDARAIVLTNALGADLRIWDEFVPRSPSAVASCATTSAATGFPNCRPASR